jgi:hypothetical protein
MSNPVMYVVVKRRNLIARVARGQTWYWQLVNAGNGKPMARYRGYYTNKGDCYEGIQEVFGSGATVYRREDGQPDIPIRLARPE